MKNASLQETSYLKFMCFRVEHRFKSLNKKVRWQTSPLPRLAGRSLSSDVSITYIKTYKKRSQCYVVSEIKVFFHIVHRYIWKTKEERLWA